jgi:hypothetical protein
VVVAAAGWAVNANDDGAAEVDVVVAGVANEKRDDVEAGIAVDATVATGAGAKENDDDGAATAAAVLVVGVANEKREVEGVAVVVVVVVVIAGAVPGAVANEKRDEA